MSYIQPKEHFKHSHTFGGKKKRKIGTEKLKDFKKECNIIFTTFKKLHIFSQYYNLCDKKS